jgi:hypothetical protein
VWQQINRDIDRSGKPERALADRCGRLAHSRIADDIGIRASVPTSPLLLGHGAAAL